MQPVLVHTEHAQGARNLRFEGKTFKSLFNFHIPTDGCSCILDTCMAHGGEPIDCSHGPDYETGLQDVFRSVPTTWTCTFGHKPLHFAISYVQVSGWACNPSRCVVINPDAGKGICHLRGNMLYCRLQKGV